VGTTRPAPPQALAKAGASYGSTPDTTVGAGPYVLKEWVRGDHATLVRNPSYYDAKGVLLDEITFKPVTDTSQKANALIAGQADIGYFPSPGTDTKALGSAGFKGYGVSQGASIALTFNLASAPWNDVRMRQAFQLAVNQPEINQKALVGQGTESTTWFPKGNPFYDKSLAIKTNDLAAAQKLVDSYVAEKGGPVNATFLLTTSLNLLGSVLVQQWGQLKNVNLKVDAQPPTATQAALVAGTYGLAITSTPLLNSVEDAYSVWHSGLTTNVIHFSDPNVDKLLDENRSLKTTAQQKGPIDKIVKIIVDDAVYIPLYYNYNQNFVSKSVLGEKQWTASHIYPELLWKKSK
jgi:ABC-type transport system substrate-binding protein